VGADLFRVDTFSPEDAFSSDQLTKTVNKQVNNSGFSTGNTPGSIESTKRNVTMKQHGVILYATKRLEKNSVFRKRF